MASTARWLRDYYGQILTISPHFTSITPTHDNGREIDQGQTGLQRLAEESGSANLARKIKGW